MKVHTKFLTIVLAFALVLTSLVGCSSNTNDNNNTAPSSNGSSGDSAPGNDANNSTNVEAIKILVGTNPSPAPYGWVEEDGSIGGFDKAFLDAVDEVIPEYTFEMENVEFDAIFSGVDSGRYLVGINNLTKTPAREEKYLFSNVAYMYNTVAISFASGRTDIQSVEDLGGKSTIISNNGSSYQQFVEAYNEANPDNPINITYSDADVVTKLNLVASGEYDFYISELANMNFQIDSFGLDLDFIELKPENAYGLLNLESWYIFPKTAEGEALRDIIDEAIQTLKENGKLDELALEYFGYEMTPYLD